MMVCHVLNPTELGMEGVMTEVNESREVEGLDLQSETCQQVISDQARLYRCKPSNVYQAKRGSATL